MLDSRIPVNKLRQVALSTLLILLMVAPLTAITFTPVNANPTTTNVPGVTAKQAFKGKPTTIGKLTKAKKPGQLILNAHTQATTKPSDNTVKTGILGNKIASKLKGLPSLANPATFPSPVYPSVAQNQLDSISTLSTATSTQGLNAMDNGNTNGFDLTPPDQGLCVGNGFALETINLVFRVYSVSSAGGFTSYSSDQTLNGLFGLPLPEWFFSDPRCLYDADTGHWFMTALALNQTDDPTLAGTNMFITIAVSQTPVPWGFWNIYFINATNGPCLDGFTSPDAGCGTSGNLQGSFTGDPGCPCLPDQPYLGADKYSFAITYNEYAYAPIASSLPALSFAGFNGDQIYLIDKRGLALGYLNPQFVYINTDPFIVPIPGAAYDIVDCMALVSFFPPSDAGNNCFSSVQPGNSPDPTQYDLSNGGTLYAVNSLDLGEIPGEPALAGEHIGYSVGDTHLAFWSFWNTKTLQDYGPHSVSNEVLFSIWIISGTELYTSPGGCPVGGIVCWSQIFQSQGPHFNPGAFDNIVPQKNGTTPLGDNVNAISPFDPSLGFPHNSCFSLGSPFYPGKCPENGLNANDDRIAGIVPYAQHEMWAALNTGLKECLNALCSIKKYAVGSAYFVLSAFGVGPGTSPSPTLVQQGYVAPNASPATGGHVESAIFPALGVGPTGNAIITFTLTGVDYFPSTAYGVVSTAVSKTVVGKIVKIADMGQAPIDDFCEYASRCAFGFPFFTEPFRPRWGDYSAAVFWNGRIYFANEYIQFPNCADSTFLLDGTCGGTRDLYANWGTSLNSIPHP